MKRVFFLATLALAGFVVPASAQSLVSDLPAKDPNAITPDAGPWVICVASYRGEEARNLAAQMAAQVRERHQMAAYVFDRGDAQMRQDWQEHLQREKACNLPPDVHLPFRHPRYPINCAVLVG